ncbi:regulator [Streptomyces sp. UH6]|uniref:regulator n=1 Tax=Streptomyces sp. UH6 TaxID=2748379 RepID=UPI0015D4BF0C|nr:regulator [Streptomyces sp. UH6]NYV73308.1 regulator [Streptomyces sp. UH6]
MTPTSTTALTPWAVHTALAYRPVIRLVSEIADHGAIPHYALISTLSDLSRTQIRRAVRRADSLHLLRRTPTSSALSPAGEELADVYEAVARWARRHNYPAPVWDFADRVHLALDLLIAEPRPIVGYAFAGHNAAERMLTDWIAHHAQSMVPGGPSEGRA